MWHHQQNNMSSINISTPRSQTEGGWLSSQQMLSEATDDSKSVSQWSFQPGHSSNPTLRLNNCLVREMGENLKKSETAPSYRLFGIDLSASSLPVENALTQPMSLSSSMTNGGVINSTESEQRSDLSKTSGENKQEQLQVASREIHRQSSSVSARSRTKVLNTISLCIYHTEKFFAVYCAVSY